MSDVKAIAYGICEKSGYRIPPYICDLIEEALTAYGAACAAQEREKWHRRIRKAAKSVEARHSDATADELFSLLSAGIYVSPLLGELDTVKE
jgi:hypothetical protein